jgi:translation initiation factor IF-2
MEKKTKLTISGGIAKKSIKNIDKAKTLGKNSVVIEKQSGKFPGKVSGFKSGFSKPKTSSSYNKGNIGKSNFNTKTPSPTSDFERIKLAELRAT